MSLGAKGLTSSHSVVRIEVCAETCAPDTNYSPENASLCKLSMRIEELWYLNVHNKTSHRTCIKYVS
jgi:hypothetical protein